MTQGGHITYKYSLLTTFHRNILKTPGDLDKIFKGVNGPLSSKFENHQCKEREANKTAFRYIKLLKVPKCLLIHLTFVVLFVCGVLFPQVFYIQSLQRRKQPCLFGSSFYAYPIHSMRSGFKNLP
jgi:hypothetical protein